MFLETAQERNAQGHALVATFQIQQHRNSDNLHLRLTGVFDEEAALSPSHLPGSAGRGNHIHGEKSREVGGQGSGHSLHNVIRSVLIICSVTGSEGNKTREGFQIQYKRRTTRWKKRNR